MKQSMKTARKEKNYERAIRMAMNSKESAETHKGWIEVLTDLIKNTEKNVICDQCLPNDGANASPVFETDILANGNPECGLCGGTGRMSKAKEYAIKYANELLEIEQDLGRHKYVKAT